MKKFVYIYANADSLKDFLGINNEELSIEPFQCETTWERQMLFFSKHHDIDGLILDSELDVYNSERMFSGSAIAQEIRISQLNGNLQKEFPIFLFCSANDKLKMSLNLSDFNLFDYYIDSEDLIVEANKSKLVSISKAYGTSFSFASLGIDESYLDERLVDELNRLSNQPQNVVVKFLITQVLEKQCPLINEDVLFARLGINKSLLEEEKLSFIENKLSAIKYKGVLSEGWSRWWAPKLEELWETEIANGTYLRSTSALHRVEMFSKYLGVDQLPVQNKIEMASSDRFWTVCKDSHLPLDPVDGFLIQGQDSFYPWQEKEYVSKFYAKNPLQKDLWFDVAPIEKERYDNILNS